MNEINELEKKIYDTISRIEMDLSIKDDKANIIDKGNEENEILEQLKKENSELKEKLFSLKKEHKSDLENLNDVLEKLNSILGEENVGS